jgi:flagellar basal body-associated protein FliL
MRQETPGWLVALIVVILVVLIAVAGWKFFFGKPRWASQMPVGETPTGQPIYQQSK